MKVSYSVIADTGWCKGGKFYRWARTFSFLKYYFRSIHFFVNQISIFVSKIWESHCLYAGAASAISSQPKLSNQLLHRMSLITRSAKEYRSRTVQYMSQNLPKRSLRDFLFYVILTISYLRVRTTETSSLPTDSLRPLFKKNRDFFRHTDCIFQL